MNGIRVQHLQIDGRVVSTEKDKAVLDGWTGETIGRVDIGTASDARAAVDAAAAAFRTGLPIPERSAILERTAEAVQARAEEIAQMIRAEVGKPITAARLEVERAVGTLRIAAQEALRLPGETVPLDAAPAGAGTLAFTVSEGRGVVAAITPFNFPINLVVHKLGPALAAGCPVVLKPSDRAPLTAGLLFECFVEAGLPDGWLNLVTGPAAEIVGAWQEDERVEIITFTGSSRIGWGLKAASPRKLHILELGSATAMIVDASADLERAAADAVTAAFANSGQACISLQRLYVTQAVAEEFIALLTERVAAVPFGDPREEATVVSALVSPEETDRVTAWVNDAVVAGAALLVGGEQRGGVLPPTLLRDAPSDAAVVCQEVFGPVLTVTVTPDLDAAVTAANASDFGLNTSLYTGALGAAMEYARRAEAGSVLINLPPSFRADHMPYGGVKDSGQGREGVRYALEEMVRQKLVVLKA